MTMLHDSAAAQGDGSIEVYSGIANVSDAQAVNELLDSVPNAEALRFRIMRESTSHHWCFERLIDFWIFSDSRRVLLLRIEGLNQQQAFTCRRVFRDRCRGAVGGKGRIDWLPSILAQVSGRLPPGEVH